MGLCVAVLLFLKEFLLVGKNKRLFLIACCHEFYVSLQKLA